MKILSLITIVAVAVIIMQNPLKADSSNVSIDVRQQLQELNRFKPLQNPKFERGTDVLDRRIIDRKNKVIGEVEDLVVSSAGRVTAIRADLDRLHLSQEVFLNVEEFRIIPLSDAFGIQSDSEDIKSQYPQLLASIETAAGDGTDSFSAKNIIGIRLWTRDGRNLGEVDDILFNQEGNAILAIYTRLDYQNLRGSEVAIPFNNISFEQKRRRFSGVLDNDFADAVIEIARANQN